ncbi:MAG: M3 family metallopeptidase [Burkholderiales bacterium]|jgi:oligopeptidase A|nr:M3 family metallopeptidase [Burkholderiales bacterium]
MNPLLDFSGLPRFADFKPAHVAPAIDQLLEENRALIAGLAADPAAPAWNNFVGPLEDANERLHRAWGQVGHLNAVMNSPELREAYNAVLPKITQYYTELGQHEGLYRKFKALRATAGFSALSPAQQKIIDNEVRDFRLGGAELPAAGKQRYTEISDRLSMLTSRFSDNLLDATNAWSHVVTDAAELAGLPDDAREAARAAAEADKQAGWKFTLHAPSYMPVLQYADNRVLRERMYRAYVTRASEFGDAKLDNTALITEIVSLRREMAQLLGFGNFAEYSLEAKMADTPAQVLQFLRELAVRAKPYARRDLKELQEFARAELGMTELSAWDYAYVSEKLRVAQYAFSENEVKQYFPETTVLPGMFKVVETLYGLSIAPAEAPQWHDDVRFFSIRDRSGALVGQFYLDLYARPSKRGGAWMDDAITRRSTAQGTQAPVAYLNCNFTPPAAKKPALFTHDEVITLFHEFGHGLHHLLTRVDYLGVSGINGVEWDAVELPSQFMENFCWEWGVVEPMTRHADSGATLPKVLFDKMLAAKNFQSGMHTVRQIEFSLFDLRLHYDFDPAGKQTTLQLLDEVRREVAVVIPPAYNRFPNNFSHIFAGGYAAGYYSYKWAEVLSADAYSLFEENGVLDPRTGMRFWDEVLAVGGSRPALESFVAFRGREPNIDALLRHNGMAAAA